MTSSRVAAIDCGTNSTRLLVAEMGDDGRLITLERLMRITRLGQGTDHTGRLDPEAIERTTAVLRDYRKIADELGVHQSRVRMAATSAARDAANRDDFFAAAQDAVGVRPEMLTGQQEGALSFAGATADLDPDLAPFLVVDIGGGSTEFAYGTAEPTETVSIQIGCVRMTEQFLHSDPPAPDELSACLSVVEVYLAEVGQDVPHARDAKTFVGLAGTVTTAAAVEIGLAEYDRDRTHHFRLSKAAAEDVFRTLATESVADRRHNPGLDPERADVIVGGMCVLVQIMRQYEYDSCLVSEADILDGLALSLLAPRQQD